MGTSVSEENITSVFFPEDGGFMYVHVYGYWQTTQCHNPEECNMNLQRYEELRIHN
jgi:hypothetical protein